MTSSADGTVELFTGDYYQDPYPVLAWLRENSPVHEFKFPVGDVPMWFVSRYEDVRAVLGDPRFSPQSRTWARDDFRDAGLVPGAGSVLERAVTVVDPPDHTRLRRLAMHAFTPRRVAGWREVVVASTEQMLAECAGRGTVDVMDDIAGPLSASVMGSILGLSLDRHHDLVDALTRAFPSDPALMGGVAEGFAKICDYAAELVAAKRHSPGDDLTSVLVTAEEAGDRLSEEELVATVAAMIMAGSDTVRAFVGNTVLALLDFPDQRTAMMGDPELVGPAVEELLRYDGALSTALFRIATEDVELGGTVLPAGAPVIASLLGANRDPERFADPDRLDIGRSPNRHVGLGHGLHNCMGAALARMEVEVAVPALFRRFPDLRPAVPRDDLRYIENWAMRRLVELPVELGSPR